MKRSRLLFSAALFLLAGSFLGSSVPSVRADDSLLKIQALPDQNSVKSGMMFLVHVQAANSSPDTSVGFWSNTCSYEKHWVTDNAAVLIQPWTCGENTLEQVTLEPGDVYEKNIILYVPKKDKTGPVTFRLGFKRMSENGDVAEPLWSDPVSMDVTVPEEMMEAAPPQAGDVAAQASGPQTPENPAGMDAAPPAPAPGSAAPAGGSQSLVFQDPGVPIKVRLGDEFSIVLASNPSTGFRWQMTMPEEQRIVSFLGSAHVASQEVMPGVPGEEVYQFKAMLPGETTAGFVYERPWETRTAPTRKIFTILVQKQ